MKAGKAQKRGWVVEGRRLMVGYHRTKTSADNPEYGYAHTYQLKDLDGTLVARIQLGLIRGFFVQHEYVKLEVKGQGCARGFLGPLLRRVVPGVLDPEEASFDVDVAVDIAVPTNQLMIVDSGARSPFRRVIVHPTSESGLEAGGMELGSRSSAVSCVLYDKLAPLRWQPAEEVLISMARRHGLVRTLPNPRRMVEVLVTRGREQGWVVTLSDAWGVVEALVTIERNNGWVPLEPPVVADGLADTKLEEPAPRSPAFSGLGALIQVQLLRAASPDSLGLKRTHKHARAIVAHTQQVLDEAADRTDLDLADLVSRSSRQGEEYDSGSTEGL